MPEPKPGLPKLPSFDTWLDGHLDLSVETARKTLLPNSARMQAVAESKVATAEVASLVEQLRIAAERGEAGWLWLDWTAIASAALPTLIAEFTATGHFAREGRDAAASVMVVSRTGPGDRTLMIDVTRPGRYQDDRRSFTPSLGTETSLTSPEVMTWLEGEVGELRQLRDTAPLPVWVLLDPSAAPSRDELNPELRERLERLASSVPCCLALAADVPGYRPGGDRAPAWIPHLEAAPAPEDLP